MDGHRIAWTLEHDDLSGKFTCDAPVGAPCRSWCTEGCEEFCIPEDNGGREHATADQGSCNILDWLGEDTAQTYYAGPTARPADGPIEVQWEGDDYSWTYAGVTQ